MGHKKILPQFYAFGTVTAGTASGTAVTGTTTYTQNLSNLNNFTDVSNIDNISWQVSWTGTPTGTISFNGSNDGVNFYPVTVTVPSQPAGSASHCMIERNQFPFRFIQMQYVNASGSGTLTAVMFGKDLN